MYLIPWQIIAIITFPGIIVHEFSHRFFADLVGVPVYKVCYFQLKKISGYVNHGEPENLKQSFFISMGPLFINTLLCAIIGSCVVYPLLMLENTNISPIIIILAWLAFSIGMYALPSKDDMLSFEKQVNKSLSKGLFYYLLKAVVKVIKLINALRIVGITIVYAAGVMLLIPYLLLTF